MAILEGVGYGARDNGLVFSVTAHIASSLGTVASFGTEGQQDEWIPGLTDGTLIGAAGITEPGSGSSLLALETSAWKVETTGS